MTSAADPGGTRRVRAVAGAHDLLSGHGPWPVRDRLAVSRVDRRAFGRRPRHRDGPAGQRYRAVRAAVVPERRLRPGCSVDRRRPLGRRGRGGGVEGNPGRRSGDDDADARGRPDDRQPQHEPRADGRGPVGAGPGAEGRKPGPGVGDAEGRAVAGPRAEGGGLKGGRGAADSAADDAPKWPAVVGPGGGPGGEQAADGQGGGPEVTDSHARTLLTPATWTFRRNPPVQRPVPPVRHLAPAIVPNHRRRPSGRSGLPPESACGIVAAGP
jgi:hypothetical protein